MQQHTEQPVTQPSTLSSAPLPGFAMWGEFVGIILIAVAMLSKDFIRRQTSVEEKEEKAEDELIEILKGEIAKRDEIIARLQNELFLTKRTLDFSGEFSPPVSNKRIAEVNKNVRP